MGPSWQFWIVKTRAVSQKEWQKKTLRQRHKKKTQSHIHVDDATLFGFAFFFCSKLAWFSITHLNVVRFVTYNTKSGIFSVKQNIMLYISWRTTLLNCSQWMKKSSDLNRQLFLLVWICIQVFGRFEIRIFVWDLKTPCGFWFCTKTHWKANHIHTHTQRTPCHTQIKPRCPINLNKSNASPSKQPWQTFNQNQTNQKNQQQNSPLHSDSIQSSFHSCNTRANLLSRRVVFDVESLSSLVEKQFVDKRRKTKRIKWRKWSHRRRKFWA